MEKGRLNAAGGCKHLPRTLPRAKKADECERFLNKVSSGELEAVVSKFTIHAIEATLNDSALILAFLRNLQGSLGLTIYETSIEDEMATSPLMNKVKLDFDDAIDSSSRIDRLKRYFLLMKRLYTLREAKKLLGGTTKTIQRWDKEGKVRVVRTIGGRRRIPESEIKRILGLKEEGVVVGYARVSSTTQKR
jgi:excisionase family DNA binding protein